MLATRASNTEGGEGGGGGRALARAGVVGATSATGAGRSANDMRVDDFGYEKATAPRPNRRRWLKEGG